MTYDIPNANVCALLDALIGRDRPPTQKEIISVVKLTYKCGHSDGLATGLNQAMAHLDAAIAVRKAAAQ